MRTLAVAALFIVALGAHDWGAAWSPAARLEAAPPVIGFRVVVDRESPADMWAQAGQQATIGIRGGLTIGLTPLLHDATIDLIVVRLADESGGGEPEEAAKLEMRLGDVVQFDVASMHLAVRWMELLPPNRDKAGASPASPCTTCCVECDGHLKCACHVITECGSCCCPNYCACGLGAAATAQRLSILLGSCSPASQMPLR